MPTYIRPAKVVVTQGGGGGALLLLAAVVVIAILIRKPVEHAADTAVRVALDVLEVAAITVASVLGLAVLGAGAYVAVRLHRSHASHRQAIARRNAPAIQRGSQGVSAPKRLAIEAPRPTLADLKALAAERGYDVVVRQAPED